MVRENCTFQEWVEESLTRSHSHNNLPDPERAIPSVVPVQIILPAQPTHQGGFPTVCIPTLHCSLMVKDEEQTDVQTPLLWAFLQLAGKHACPKWKSISAKSAGSSSIGLVLLGSSESWAGLTESCEAHTELSWAHPELGSGRSREPHIQPCRMAAAKFTWGTQADVTDQSQL